MNNNANNKARALFSAFALVSLSIVIAAAAGVVLIVALDRFNAGDADGVNKSLILFACLVVIWWGAIRVFVKGLGDDRSKQGHR